MYHTIQNAFRYSIVVKGDDSNFLIVGLHSTRCMRDFLLNDLNKEEKEING